MNLLTFGVLRNPGPLRESPIDAPPGLSVSVLAVAGLTAAYTSLTSREPPTVRRILDYARVVETIHRREAILPMRYGSWFDSEADLKASLLRRSAALIEALNDLDGCDEMSIGLPPPEDPPRSAATATAIDPPRAPERPGAAHMLRLREQYAERDAIRTRNDAAFARIRRVLQGSFVRCREGPMTARGIPRLLSMAFLVRRSGLEEFRRAVDALREQPGGDRIRLSGPWPPYHFASDQLKDSAP